MSRLASETALGESLQRRAHGFWSNLLEWVQLAERKACMAENTCPLASVMQQVAAISTQQ